MIQKFGFKAFKTIKYNLEKQGYKVDILYNPTAFLTGPKQVQAVQLSKEEIKNKLAAEKAKEREDLKKEILAELIASGAITVANEPTGTTTIVETPVAPVVTETVKAKKLEPVKKES